MYNVVTVWLQTCCCHILLIVRKAVALHSVTHVTRLSTCHCMLLRVMLDVSAYHQQTLDGDDSCRRGQLGKQVTEQLLVEHVRDLSAYDAKTLTELFGESTGTVVWLLCLFDIGRHGYDLVLYNAGESRCQVNYMIPYHQD